MRIYFMAILICFAGCALHETDNDRTTQEVEEIIDVAVEANQATDTHSTNVCPMCNSTDQVRSIMYGDPPDDILEAGIRGDIILGGCEPKEESKGCLNCGHRW